MKKTVKKLQLSRETLGSLRNSQLTGIRGADGPGPVVVADPGQLALTSNYSYREPCCVCV
jgi:hypothetical protein